MTFPTCLIQDYQKSSKSTITQDNQGCLLSAIEAGIFSKASGNEAKPDYNIWLAKVLPYCFKALELDFMEFLGKKLALKYIIQYRMCK